MPGIGEFESPIGFHELSERVSRVLNENIKSWKNSEKPIKRVGIITGAGNSTKSLRDAHHSKCDVYYITSNLQCRGSEQLNIREAHEGDYPELRKLYLESRRNTFVWDNIIEMTLEDFDKHTEDEFIIIAEEAGILMGFTSLYLPDNFIHNLFVHPNCSGKGVGSRLLQAANDKMNKPMRLKCVSKNHKALTFYERNGWKKVVEEGRPGEEKYWVMEYK